MFLSQSFRYEMKQDCMFSLLCCLHAAVFLFLHSCHTVVANKQFISIQDCHVVLKLIHILHRLKKQCMDVTLLVHCKNKVVVLITWWLLQLHHVGHNIGIKASSILTVSYIN